MKTPSWQRAAAAGLIFRPAADADLPFLQQLYAATRAAELAPVPWSAAQKQAFLAMQFEAQHAHYRKHYAGAHWLMIEHSGEPVGRLYLARWHGEHRIIDIGLVPQHCGKGFGGALLQDLLDEAAAAGKAVTIHVEGNNPAMRLYRRLGFACVEDKGVYQLMRWPSPPAPMAPPAAPQVNTAS